MELTIPVLGRGQHYPLSFTKSAICCQHIYYWLSFQLLTTILIFFFFPMKFSYEVSKGLPEVSEFRKCYIYDEHIYCTYID